MYHKTTDLVHSLTIPESHVSYRTLISAGRIPQALFEVLTLEEIDLHGNKFFGEDGLHFLLHPSLAISRGSLHN